MAARSRSTRTWKIAGAVLATTAALGAAALPAAQARTATLVTGTDPGGNERLAQSDAARRCQNMGGSPGQPTASYTTSEGARVTIVCILP